MAPVADLEIGTVLSGTYKVTAKLGEGGMGSVYRAEHQRLPRPYAIKVLHEVVEPESEYYHRFRREAEICSRLRHENIVEVVDFNVTPDDRPYIAMELLDGEDLETRLQRVGRLTVAETVEIIGQVAEGLAEAHEQGVVHRDLKPQNIFLCKRRKGGDLVKIVDFGISKIQGSVSVLTSAFAMVGTPHYMSPEQTGAGSGKATARSDIYALGVIAYQMLSAKLPINGDNIAQLVMAINAGTPRPLREVSSGVSAAVEAVIHVALAKDPAQRFLSVTDFHEALRRAVEMGDVVGLSPDDSVAETLAAPEQVPPDSAESAVPVEPTQLTPSPAPAPSATVSGGGSSAAKAPPAISPLDRTTLSSAASEVELPVPAPPQPSSRGKIAAGAIAVVVLLGVGIAWIALRGADSPSRKRSAKAPSTGATPDGGISSTSSGAVIARPVVQALPRPGRVVVLLKGLPDQARCTVNDKAVEGNPLVIPRGSAPVRLRCQADGFRPWSITLKPDRDQTRTVLLEPQPRGMARPSRRRIAVSKRPPATPSMRRRVRPVMRRRARPIDSNLPIE